MGGALARLVMEEEQRCTESEMLGREHMAVGGGDSLER